MKKILVVIALILAFSPTVVSAEDLNYNLYHLQASASREIANDLMVATLITNHQAATAESASNEVNQDMEWALEQLEGESEIVASTERYNSWPQYRSEKIVGWNVSQTLRIESVDFEVLTDLIGELQTRMQVQSMSFTVKTETREAAENELIAEALDAYRARAMIVSKSMNAESYDVVTSNINTQNYNSPYYARAESASMSSVARAAPAVESGESKVTVTVNGQIQLVF